MSVQTFAQRYDRVVSTSLGILCSPSQQVTYDISVLMVDVECNQHEGHNHEVPALCVTWSVADKETCDLSSIQIPLYPDRIEDEDLVHEITAAWSEMIFSRQAYAMAELDEQLDALAEGESNS